MPRQNLVDSAILPKNEELNIDLLPLGIWGDITQKASVRDSSDKRKVVIYTTVKMATTVDKVSLVPI